MQYLKCEPPTFSMYIVGILLEMCCYIPVKWCTQIDIRETYTIHIIHKENWTFVLSNLLPPANRS